MERNIYQWQGEKVKVTFGYCKVTENLEKPLWWYNYECNWDDYNNKPVRGAYVKTAIIPAVKVHYENKYFAIANHFGIGVHKLINGGWPNYRHFSLPIETFKSDMTKHEAMYLCIRQFDLEGFEDYESKRNKWQAANFPDEVAKRRLIFGV